jgi:hypothetical protein
MERLSAAGQTGLLKLRQVRQRSMEAGNAHFKLA